MASNFFAPLPRSARQGLWDADAEKFSFVVPNPIGSSLDAKHRSADKADLPMRHLRGSAAMVIGTNPEAP